MVSRHRDVVYEVPSHGVIVGKGMELHPYLRDAIRHHEGVRVFVMGPIDWP